MSVLLGVLHTNPLLLGISWGVWLHYVVAGCLCGLYVLDCWAFFSLLEKRWSAWVTGCGHDGAGLGGNRQGRADLAVGSSHLAWLMRSSGLLGMDDGVPMGQVDIRVLRYLTQGIFGKLVKRFFNY